MGQTTFTSPVSIKRLNDMEAFITSQQKPPTSKEVAEHCNLSASANAAYLRRLESDWRVHSKYSDRLTTKIWVPGPRTEEEVRVVKAPKPKSKAKVVDDDKIDLPVVHKTVKTWAAIVRRDPLVKALFGNGMAAA